MVKEWGVILLLQKERKEEKKKACFYVQLLNDLKVELVGK